MAKRSSPDLPGRAATARQNCLQNLRAKLQQQLENDLAKLLLHSNHLDLELVVDSESLFSHSCIVKTRAARFYTFITTECCVSRSSGSFVTTVFIENASIVYIRKFLENIYSSAFLPESETYVLKYLQHTRGQSRRPNQKLASPEVEAFFTPKCSPSELYKPFTLLAASKEEISLSRTQNNANVQSYYRIVSVEDITAESAETPLEKELAEQDELFQSLKVISTKKKSVSKPSSLALSRKQPWRETREPIKRLPAWKPKLSDCELPFNRSPICRVQRSPLMMSSSPEVDVSSTPDSGMEMPAVPMDTSTDGPITDTSEGTSQEQHAKTDESPSDCCKVFVDTIDSPAIDKSLDERDICRLEEMEKNIEHCEMFISKEKEVDEKARRCVDVEGAASLILEPVSLPVLSTPPSSPTPNVPNGFSANHCKSPPSTSFFIDASSLLDEDEISSPPMSLPHQSVHNGCDDVMRTSGTDSDLERKQGELIFKTSIPHYSRHEVEEPQRILSSSDDFESEQVVPVVSSLIDDTDGIDRSGYSRSLPYDGIASLDLVRAASMQPVLAVPTPPVSLKQLTAREEPLKITEPTDIPHRKISVECMPIVSGGASPKDFSMPSYTSSPHLPRRHEQVPIISGGMDLPSPVEKVPARKSHPTGEVWVVDVGPSKPIERRLMRGTSSESDSENGRKERISPKLKFVEDLKSQSPSPVSTKDSALAESLSSERHSFPVEKSASLGYFIDFGSNEGTPPAPRTKKHRNDSSSLKKNIFSMFIDINKDEKGSGGESKAKGSDETITGHDSDGTESGSVSSKASSKKGLYMFIEAESPGAKKTPSAASIFKPHALSTKMTNFSLDAGNDEYSLESIDSKRSNVSSERASEERDVWNWDNTSHQQPSHEGHLLRQPEVKAEGLFKKDSTFIIDGMDDKYRTGPHNSAALHTVIEATPPKSPIKSPKAEEGDSGVVATEESDDSFVRLSDMDNTAKNPYLGSKRRQDVQKTAVVDSVKRKQSGRMSQSIPEGGWSLKRQSKIPEREKAMSRSTGGASAMAASSSGGRVSKSLSRLFPHLSASALSLARTHTSDYSEPSSMLSSIDPYGLDMSTSETDVSCQGDGAIRLGQDLLRMFLDEISPDVVVEVAGRRIKAHKCILSSRCQYFAAMLSGGWVESAGNVISLQGFSYAAVHFALCHIYCGESEVPDSLNIVELATLADMLCLEGLKEVISYTLRVKYCHSFHPPCGACTAGVMDCLPVAADYGLDDLYRKCLRWTAKFFVKVWPTKAFANLRKEHIDKCLQYQVIHMTAENVLDTLLSIDKIRGTLPSIRWAESVTKAVNKLQDASVKFVAEHFSSILTSDQFLALGKDAEWSIERLERSLIQATNRLPPEQACWSHARLHSIISVATSPNPPEEMQWNETFVILLSTLSEYVQNSLIKQAPRAARSKAWLQMEPELRSVIQEAACLVLPASNTHTPRRPANPKVANAASLPSSLRSSTRASDLRQVKLAMTQQSAPKPANNASTFKRPLPPPQPRVQNDVIKRQDVRKSQSTSAVRETVRQPISAPPRRFAEVKSRYMQPRSPRKTGPNSALPKKDGISSSDSSRNCSPAMARAASAKTCKRTSMGTGAVRSASTATVRPLTQLAPDDNMSTDSLATLSSCGEKDTLARRQNRGKENSQIEKSGTLPRKTQSLSSFPSAAKKGVKTMIPRMEVDNKRPWRRTTTAKSAASAGRVTSAPASAGAPKTRPRAPSNATNGNPHASAVDSENNATNAPFKPPAFVSRSGTFLKDEPTVLKKPEADIV